MSNGTRGSRNGWDQPKPAQDIGIAAWLEASGSRVFPELERGSAITFDDGSWHQRAQLVLPFLPVSSVFDKSGQRIGMHFYAIKTLQLDPSQTEPYFEVTIPNSYS